MWRKDCNPGVRVFKCGAGVDDTIERSAVVMTRDGPSRDRSHWPFT